MKKLLSTARNKLGMVLAVAAGVVVGGVGSAIVLASVPDSNGVIHACYENAKFRIIDTATTPNCDTKETALNWNQHGPKGDTGAPGPQGPPGPSGSSLGLVAYAHVRMDSNGNASLDAPRSYNISDIHSDPSFATGFVCLTTPSTPRTISVIKANGGGSSPANNISFKDDNGWTRIDSTSGAPFVCDQISPSANVGFSVPVSSVGQDFFDSFVQIY